jgi:serine/threonine protein kinase
LEIGIGQEFLGYRILHELGQGGFGAVYRARRIQPGSGGGEDDYVAIKVLHPVHSEDPVIRHRFHREARLAKKLSHPNVVRIFDHGEKDGVHYIVMEFARGLTLLQFMQEGTLEEDNFEIPGEDEEAATVFLEGTCFSQDSPRGALSEDDSTVSLAAAAPGDPDVTVAPGDLDATVAPGDLDATVAPSAGARDMVLSPESPDVVYPVLEQCAAVLQAANQVGLIHRDIKPENILVRRGRNRRISVKILDFGLAKNFVDQSMEISVEGQAIGTPAYMSPEQFRGAELDIRSDLYSLGATFYTFLTGKRPFEGPSVKEFMHQILHETPEPVDRVNKKVDRGLAAVIEKLMRKDPGARYQEPVELIEDIRRLVRGELPVHRDRLLRRRRTIAAGAAGVLAVLVIATVFFVSRRPSGGGEAPLSRTAPAAIRPEPAPSPVPSKPYPEPAPKSASAPVSSKPAPNSSSPDFSGAIPPKPNLVADSPVAPPPEDAPPDSVPPESDTPAIKESDPHLVTGQPASGEAAETATVEKETGLENVSQPPRGETPEISPPPEKESAEPTPPAGEKNGDAAPLPDSPEGEEEEQEKPKPEESGPEEVVGFTGGFEKGKIATSSRDRLKMLLGGKDEAAAE